MQIFLLLVALILGAPSDSSTSSEVKIVEDYTSINSFEEVLNRFPGKVLYIDLWATWCPPCRAEFGHTAMVKEFAEGKEIEFVYISLDKESNTRGWERFIEKHQISGNHLLANRQLRADLKENYYSEIVNGEKQIYMPAYLIVDKNGQLYHRDARRPSEKKKLLKQLHKALKK